MSGNLRSLKRSVRTTINTVRVYGKPKIFGIGFNKTGTTSLKIAMDELGFVVGNEFRAKFLFDDWVKRDFSPIEKYCRSAQFFQDSPFSLPYTFVAMDQAFPKSKFVLTVRDDPEQWYNSLIRFHGKLWGNGNVPPTAEDLKRAKSKVYTGRPFHTLLNIYKVTESDPYNKEVLTKAYLDHIRFVEDYFRHRPHDLVKINVSEKGSYIRLCDFLKVEPKRNEFPWENRTDKI